MKFKNLVTTLISSGILLAGTNTQTNAQAPFGVIDLITEGGQLVEVGRGRDNPFSEVSSSFPDTIPDTIIGGYRDLSLSNLTGTGPIRAASGGVNIDIDPLERTIDYSNDTGVSSTLSITYDGLDNSAAVNTRGLDGLDLISVEDFFGNAFSYDALTVDFLLSDLGQLSLTAQVWDMAGRTSQGTFNFTNPVTDLTSVNFLYSQRPGVFPNPLEIQNPVRFVGNANFKNIGAIELRLTGAPAVDAQIFVIGQVDLGDPIPEPSAVVGLIAVAGLGSIFSRRKS